VEHPESQRVVREHHLQVERTARWASLGEPRPGVREVWIACHGCAQLASRFLRALEEIATPTRLVAAPEALNRFYLETPSTVADVAQRRVGATWMTREDRDAEIADYVAYLDRLRDHLAAACPGARLTALGFSQGVATVCRWVALGRARVDHLVLWSGPVPADLDLGRLAARLDGARVTLVVGEADSLVKPAEVDAGAERLRSVGIACDVVRFDGIHVVHPATLRRIADGP